MKHNLAIMRGGAIFTTKAWPVRYPNPAKFKVMIFRDGQQVGAARTKKEAEQRINLGYYDEDTHEAQDPHA
jgi:hypothetical protein